MKGGANGQRFYDFFQCLTNDVRQKIGSKVVYYLDNGSCHDYKILKQYIRLNKIHVVFGVPYICSYNMAEYVFGYIKRTYYLRIVNKE
jgi:transposase